MLLIAQRVRSARDKEGINAFCYHHGVLPGWRSSPPDGIPDADPGKRVNQKVGLPPGGNRVLSYLDIIAPDGTPTGEIIDAVPRFLSRRRKRTLPWIATVGRCTFRFEVQPALTAQWAAEFKALLYAALTVRPQA